MRKNRFIIAGIAAASIGSFALMHSERHRIPGDLRDAPADTPTKALALLAAGGGRTAQAPEPMLIPVPSNPQYTETPRVGGWNNGLYRPYVPSKDTVKAVLFAPQDNKKDAIKHYGSMDAQEVESAISQTAAELTKMKVKAIIVASPGPSLRSTLADIEKLGGDMRYVETFNKADPHYNQIWFRDYGLLPLKNLQTGKWENVDLIIRGAPLPDLSAFARDRFGMETIASLDVTATGGQLRGGNIMVDGAGRCFSAGFKHPLFESTIKCVNTVTLPCRSEVCHVDEYVTFLKNDTVVTNKEEFVPALQEAGYTRIRLVPDDKHLSLTNVLIVNDTVFLMYLDELKEQMEKTKQVFEKEGYRVVPVNSGGAGEQYGAIHCLTKEIPN
jgi:hypothetical protein